MKRATKQNRRADETKNRGGRPRKFREPCQPVTVTLPQRILDRLKAINPDRARAIVKAVDHAAGNDKQAPQVEVLEMAPGTGLLVVSPNASLANLPWLKMIQIAPARYLLAVDSGTAIEKMEIALLDLIDDARASAHRDVPMLEALREKFARLRRDERISKAEILFVDTET